MGVSFKISKTGTRFRAKPAFQFQSVVDEVSGEPKEKPETTKQKVSFFFFLVWSE